VDRGIDERVDPSAPRGIVGWAGWVLVRGVQTDPGRAPHDSQ